MKEINLYLALILLGIAIVLFRPLCAGAVNDNFDSVDYSKAPQHPRLLLNKNDVNNVKNLISERDDYRAIHSQIMSDCVLFMDEPVLERKLQGKRMLGVSSSALKRIFYLSYAYRTTDSIKYANRAIAEIKNVCGFSDWNPSHFLDVAEMAMGVAIGYDWLYDLLDDDAKNNIVEALRQKAFMPSLNSRNAWFYKRANNWNSVCNAGLVFAALATMEDLPDVANRIIEKCLDSNPKAVAEYGPDGGYPEGYNYWDYGTFFQLLLFDVLDSVLGVDGGISKTEGFMKSPYFMQFMETPSGNCFNFSDSPVHLKGLIPMWWFASRLNDRSLLYLEEQKLKSNSKLYARHRLLPCLLVFASRIDYKNLKGKNIPKEKFWFSRGKVPVFVYRGGWDDKRDTYLGVKGGSATESHAHMDAGEFVYERDGIRWAIDLGSQDYYSLEKEGVDLWNQSQNGGRWDVLRLRNEFHNTITIDGERHLVNGKAEIIDTMSSVRCKGAVVDLTSTLGKLKRANRTVFLDENDDLTIIDSIINGNQPAKLMWVMVTQAEASIIDGNSILLKKGGKEMKLSVESSAPIEMHIWNNTPINSYDAPNNGSLRVGYTSELPANYDGNIKVRLTLLDSK